MNMRPETTLFLLMSVDGKISSGDTDVFDVDRDWKRIHGVKEGLHQYYDAEKLTDYFSLNTGRVMAKIGVNDQKDPPKKIAVQFVIIDNKPHLTKQGVDFLCQWVEHLFLVTTNEKHPSLTDNNNNNNNNNCTVISYKKQIDFLNLFQKLCSEFGAQRLTIQSGGTLNTTLLRLGLIDHLSLIVAPILVGGSTTSTLLDGEALHKIEELSQLKALKLTSCTPLDHSYLHLNYDVIDETIID